MSSTTNIARRDKLRRVQFALNAYDGDFDEIAAGRWECSDCRALFVEVRLDLLRCYSPQVDSPSSVDDAIPYTRLLAEETSKKLSQPLSYGLMVCERCGGHLMPPT